MSNGPGTADRSDPAGAMDRRLVLLEIDPASRIGGACFHPPSGTRAVRIGDSPVDAVETLSPPRAVNLLGDEFDLVIYDALAGVDPDALGIVGGCIPAHGALVLVIPREDARHPHWDTPYHRRFRRLLNGFTDIERIDTPGQFVPRPPRRTGNPTTECLTDDQSRAVAAVVRVLEGGRRRPAILVADRGRGKSAALGLAAARILQDPDRRVVVSGRSRRSAEIVFRHASQSCGSAVDRMTWMEIPQLLQQGTNADIVLVDEAAGVPLHHLEALLRRFPRIAMATTVHGYEGSGRGFILRFRCALDRLTRGWRHVALDTPIRWAAGDSLEAQLDGLLLLSAGLPDPGRNQSGNRIRIRAGSPASLVDNEEELDSVFSLLVAAHYRTRPSDLKQLLDDRNVILYRLQVEKDAAHVTVGALLGVRETAPETSLADDILHGRRRPPGFVLAELLAGQMGIDGGIGVNMMRIQRIVIHPALRRSGLGTMLLQRLLGDLADTASLVGTNFAVDAGLIRFWRRAGFVPVRLGSRQSPRSGAVSGLFLASLDPIGEQVLRHAARQFSRQFPAALSRNQRHLEPEIVDALLRENPYFDLDPDASDLNRVGRYTRRELPGDAIPATLALVVQAGLARGHLIDAGLCIQRVLQGHDWRDCEAMAGDHGKRDGEARLRASCAHFLESTGFHRRGASD